MRTSGELPIYRGEMRPTLRMSEVAALLAVAQDYALGQPPGAQLRATSLAQHLAAEAELAPAQRASAWWTSALRFLGCTGHAFDMAVVFGDEIEMRARSAQADFSNPFEVLRVMISSAGPGRRGPARLSAVLSLLAGGKKAAEMNFRTACEVADVFAKRLGMNEEVAAALRTSFERWNGRGLPNGVKGTGIPVEMRVAQLTQELEILARVQGIEDALEIVRSRKGRAYDPALTDITLTHGAAWWAEVEDADPWDAALACAPAAPYLGEDSLHEALLVLADFADLKSPWTGGHSREVAALARHADGPTAEAAALLHDLGRVAVPNSVWDKPGPFNRDERDRAETHALVTDQLLRRLAFTARLAPIASSGHERQNGSGYHRHAGAAQLDRSQRVLAAADCYQAMVSDRPHRPAMTPDAAAAELRAMGSTGVLDAEAVEGVLTAAGHRATKPAHPAGLSARQAQVLRLVALGLTTREVADRLAISPKTADHHVQDIYAKIGASTRGAAALFAIENGILTTDSA